MSDINMYYENILTEKLREVPEHVRVFFNAECAWLCNNNPDYKDGYIPTAIKIIKYNRIVRPYGEKHLIPEDYWDIA